MRMHSTSRCACLIFTWCLRQGWKLHPRTTRGGRQAQRGLPMLSPPLRQPHRCKSHYIPHPHAHPGCLGHYPSLLRCSPSFPPSHGATKRPVGPSRPCCRAGHEPGKQLLQPLPLLLSQLPAHDLFNPKLSSHKYTSSWQETCLSYACPLLLREPFPAALTPCTSPWSFLPAPLRYFRHATKICCSTRTLKLPVKVQEAL